MTILISILFGLYVVLSGATVVSVPSLPSEGFGAGQTVTGGQVKFSEPINVGSGSATSTVYGSATSTFPNGIMTGELIATTTILTDLSSCDTIDTDSQGKLKCGTDAGGSGTTEDIQDGYNLMDAAAQITTSNSKDLIVFLQDTATPPNFALNFETTAGGQFLVQDSTSGVGTTTRAVITRDGSLGIGSTTPGAGLVVSATSTILSGRLYIDDHLRVSYIISTSTQNNSFGGALDVTEAATSTFTGGISASTGGLLTTTGLTVTGGKIESTGLLTVTNVGTSTFSGGINVISNGGLSSASGLSVSGGDIQSSGKLTVTSTATSTFAGEISGTLISSSAGLVLSGGHLVSSGRLEVTNAATSTFSGGLSVLTTGGLSSAQGLTVTGGKIESSGVLSVSNTGTSTIAGTLELNLGGTGTSTAPNLEILSSLRIGGAIYTNIASTSANTATTTATLDCSLAPKWSVVMKEGIAVNFKNCYGGQSLIVIVDNISDGSDDQIDWDGILPPDGGDVLASSSIKWNKMTSTSTPGYLATGATTMCGFLFATTSDGLATYALGECEPGGYAFR